MPRGYALPGLAATAPSSPGLFAHDHPDEGFPGFSAGPPPPLTSSRSQGLFDDDEHDATTTTTTAVGEAGERSVGWGIYLFWLNYESKSY
jgi:hypothetical protein